MNRALHPVAGSGGLVLEIDGSRLFRTDARTYDALAAGDREAERELLAQLGTLRPPRPLDGVRARPAALSLNLAQSCNLACTYCYADEGRFGGASRTMARETALAAVREHVRDRGATRVTLGFMGGEPLLARELMEACVDEALSTAAPETTVAFSVTTNATLVRDEDAAFFGRYGFTVTVSVDGDDDVQNAARPARRGRPSSASVRRGVATLLAAPGRIALGARATVTRGAMNVTEIVEAIAAMGFTEVGVSPLRTGPDASSILRGDDWPAFLAEMRRAAVHERRRLLDGAAPRFANLVTAMREIHSGTARRLPCGAGDNYVSVGADGGYFTCHRTIDRAEFALGSVASGLDLGAREAFVAQRDVATQAPCSTCWARWLCGGGCHAEVAVAGRDGCDYIRGWLETAMLCYDELLDARPDLFASGER